MENTHRPLTLATATDLAAIIGWAQRCARITWAVNGDPERLRTGVARCIGDENGNLTFDQDVRDLYLKVSGTYEHFLPISDVLVQLRAGLIFVG